VVVYVIPIAWEILKTNISNFKPLSTTSLHFLTFSGIKCFKTPLLRHGNTISIDGGSVKSAGFERVYREKHGGGRMWSTDPVVFAKLEQLLIIV
jgi:hypothetical protein